MCQTKPTITSESLCFALVPFAHHEHFFNITWFVILKILQQRKSLKPVPSISITLTIQSSLMSHGDLWPAILVCSLDSLWMSVVCAYNDDGPHCYMNLPSSGQLTFTEDRLYNKHCMIDDLTGVLKCSLLPSMHTNNRVSIVAGSLHWRFLGCFMPTTD